MKSTFFATFALNMALVPAVFAAPTTQVAVIEVKGEVTKPQVWTLAQLQKLAPVQTIKTTLKGEPCTARGADGYLASFSMPELLPEAGNKAAFVVWESDGKPLSAKEGALRLVVPNEKKPMPWVYNLVAIEVYDGKKLSSH